MESQRRLSHGDGGDSQSDEVYDSAIQTSNAGTPQRNRSEINVRKTRSQEAVTTLLSAFGDSAEQCSDEFARQDIKFKDLSALSQRDLMLLGITDPETQSAMLDTFHELPNQDMHYERFCESDEAQQFNEQILGRARSHINSMNTSLSAAYLKMRVNPSNDVIVDDSIFASRFVLEALDELKKATEETENRLRALEQIAIRNSKLKLSNTERNLYSTVVIIAGMCTGVAVAYWYWKGR